MSHGAALSQVDSETHRSENAPSSPPPSQVRAARVLDETERDEQALAEAAAVPLSWIHCLDADARDPRFSDVLAAVNRAFAEVDDSDEPRLNRLLDALPGLSAMATSWNKVPVAIEFLERAAPLVAMASAERRARFWLTRGTLKRAAGEPIEAEKCFAAAIEAAPDGELALLAELGRAVVLIRAGRSRDAERCLLLPLAAHGTPVRAEALRLMATARALVGEPSAAEAFAREAFRAHIALERTPRPTFVILLSTLFAENGHFAEARAQLQTARAGFELEGRSRWVALCDSNLGSIALDEGNFESAAVHYSAAVNGHLASGEAFEAGVACGYWGAALLLDSQAARAVDRLERALQLCAQAATSESDALGDPRRGTRLFTALLAVATAHERTAISAQRALELLQRVPAGEFGDLRRAVAIFASPRDKRPIAIREAMLSAEGSTERAAGFMRRVETSVLRMVLRTEGNREGRIFRLAQDGSWFETERGRVDLTTRLALRRLLVALARSAQTAPGALMTAPELIAEGWPGERILPAAARGRLRVAICTLRKFGIREFLTSSRHGHALEAKIEFVATEAAVELALDQKQSPAA